MQTRIERSELMFSKIGTAMFVSWLLFLGPVGLLLLLVVAYAMIAQNVVLGVIGGLLLAAPVALAAAWIPHCFFALLKERKAPSVAPVGETAGRNVSVD